MELKIPEGMPTGLGNCGIVGIAIFCGVPYQPVEDFIRKHSRKPSNWKGGTRKPERDAALREFNKSRSVTFKSEGMTLATFVRKHARQNHVYLVRTTGHIQVVLNGMVIDQAGPRPISEHWGRNKHMSYATVRKL
jgi:hypothetical protein